MKTLLGALLAGAGFLASTSAARAQYFGYNYGAQVYYPPGFGTGFRPGFGYGFVPGVNQTVISVTPYWRPLVLNTPVVTTPLGPNYFYSNSYSFRPTPFGFNWSASRFQWVDGGIYSPPAFAYPGFGYPVYGSLPVNPVPVEPVVVVPRGRIYRGFVPVVSPLAGQYVESAVVESTGNGSFTPWGAFIPGAGVFMNPFSGVAVR